MSLSSTRDEGSIFFIEQSLNQMLEVVTYLFL